MIARVANEANRVLESVEVEELRGGLGLDDRHLDVRAASLAETQVDVLHDGVLGTQSRFSVWVEGPPAL